MCVRVCVCVRVFLFLSISLSLCLCPSAPFYSLTSFFLCLLLSSCLQSLDNQPLWKRTSLKRPTLYQDNPISSEPCDTLSDSALVIVWRPEYPRLFMLLGGSLISIILLNGSNLFVYSCCSHPAWSGRLEKRDKIDVG